MDFEDKKRIRRRRRSIQRLLVFIIGLYFFINSSNSIFSVSSRTVLPEIEIWKEKIVTQGLLIKEEDITAIADENSITRHVEEGQRVSIGTRIISLLSNNHGLEEELRELDKAIATLESVNGLNNSNNNMDSESLTTSSIEALEDKRKKIQSQLNHLGKAYSAKISGIVSYELDGLENILIPQEFNHYTYKELSLLEEEIGSKEKDTDLTGYKVINNFDWFLAIKIDKSTNDTDFTIGNKLTIELPQVGHELIGRIVGLNKSSDGSVILFKANNYLHEFYNHRVLDVNIIRSKKDSYKIPSKALINHEGLDGVLVKTFNGIIKFKPVIVLHSKDGSTHVSRGDDGSNIELNEEKVKTISTYDEIISNPSNVSDREIIY